MGVVSPVVGLLVAIVCGAAELPCIGAALVCCPIALGVLLGSPLGSVEFLLTVLCKRLELQ